ncbi:MAG TPA: hypothetical protein VEC37_05145, partial [Bacillota bacterium]|nr:hypothetical protein [Bacillota bacterium]
LVNFEDGKTLEIQFVDLTKYYNNNGFATNSSLDKKAQLNVSSRVYFLPEGLPSGEIIEVGRMKFRFPVISEGKNDNVYGCGQWIEVEVPTGNYQTIMLLGFSLLKGYAGTLTVLYEDGQQEEVDFALSHIGAAFPLYGETVAWEGLYYEKKANAKAHLFCKEYRLAKKGTIKAIKLPDWPMFSIVSISLGK